MRLVDGTLRLSPSDLTAHLGCAHKTTLELRAARGEIVKPKLASAHGDLLRRKGVEHEAGFLAQLVVSGRTIVRIPTYDDAQSEGVAFDAGEARRLTEEAVRAGVAEVIYQPYLVSDNGRWRGFADFLERQPGGGYEPVDTKLARSAKPGHVVQLLFYAEQVERLQGRAVERVHVENGLGERETFRVAEFDAYYRRIRGGSSRRSARSRRRTGGRTPTAASATSGTCAGRGWRRTIIRRWLRGCGGRGRRS